MPNPFHLAIPVRDITESRQFYGEVLGLEAGRSSEHWVDFNLMGHQLVIHLDASLGPAGQVPQVVNPVDSKSVPVPHFGVVLDMTAWQLFADQLNDKPIRWVIEPYIRFKGQVGEQATLFFLDPSGNTLEFKGFQDIEAELFAK